MKELLIEYKLIDHTTKQMTKHTHCVKLPWADEITQNDVEQIKNQAKVILEQMIVGYKLIKDSSSKKEKKVLVDGVLKQVKFFKKCCYTYSKGDNVCDEATIFKYKWLEGTRTKSDYVDKILQQKKETTIIVETTPSQTQQVTQPQIQQAITQPVTQSQTPTAQVGFLESLGLVSSQQPTQPVTTTTSNVLTGGGKLQTYKLKCLHA